MLFLVAAVCWLQADGMDCSRSFDDSVYDVPEILEFSFMDEEGRSFCLYHDVRNVPDFDFDDYEMYVDWAMTNTHWCIQEAEDFSIVWNYTNGAILIMETEAPSFFTARGIKAGDSYLDAMKAYELGSDIYRINPASGVYERVSDCPDNLFVMYEADDVFTVFAANMIDEEMMRLSVYNEGDFVSRIQISIDIPR